MHGTPILGQHWVEIDLGAPMLVTSVVRHMHAVGQDGCSVYASARGVRALVCVCALYGWVLGGCCVGLQVAACCSVLQCVAACCNVFQREVKMPARHMMATHMQRTCNAHDGNTMNAATGLGASECQALFYSSPSTRAGVCL